jgi:Zn-dependent metalloprotease
MNNAFYEKTMENIRNRCDIKLLTEENKIQKYINKPNFKDSIIFNENLVAIVNNVTSIKFNKPIYLGQAILDYSKQLMYNFYYNVINKLWPDNEIVFGDTDSLVLSSLNIIESLKFGLLIYFCILFSSVNNFISQRFLIFSIVFP